MMWDYQSWPLVIFTPTRPLPLTPFGWSQIRALAIRNLHCCGLSSVEFTTKDFLKDRKRKKIAPLVEAEPIKQVALVELTAKDFLKHMKRKKNAPPAVAEPIKKAALPTEAEPGKEAAQMSEKEGEEHSTEVLYWRNRKRASNSELIEVTGDKQEREKSALPPVEDLEMPVRIVDAQDSNVCSNVQDPVVPPLCPPRRPFIPSWGIMSDDTVLGDARVATELIEGSRLPRDLAYGASLSNEDLKAWVHTYTAGVAVFSVEVFSRLDKLVSLLAEAKVKNEKAEEERLKAEDKVKALDAQLLANIDTRMELAKVLKASEADCAEALRKAHDAEVELTKVKQKLILAQNKLEEVKQEKSAAVDRAVKEAVELAAQEKATAIDLAVREAVGAAVQENAAAANKGRVLVEEFKASTTYREALLKGGSTFFFKGVNYCKHFVLERTPDFDFTGIYEVSDEEETQAKGVEQSKPNVPGDDVEQQRSNAPEGRAVYTRRG